MSHSLVHLSIGFCRCCGLFLTSLNCFGNNRVVTEHLRNVKIQMSTRCKIMNKIKTIATATAQNTAKFKQLREHKPKSYKNECAKCEK